MDDRSLGAAELISALSEGVHAFQKFGSEQYLSHYDSVRRFSLVASPPAVVPLVMVGVSFELNERLEGGEPREALVHVSLQVSSDGLWVVKGEVEADDPRPHDSASVPQLHPFDLPEVRTPDVDECVALIRDYTARLCAYTAVLDDLGVPRS